jgi:hypothetical protein
MATTKITSPDLFDLGSLNTSLKLPSGTTAERPTSPSTGEWRYNTTTNLVEFWDGGAWRELQDEDIPIVPSENFNVVLYTGNGSTQSITGVGFKPDWVWIKERSAGESHRLFDSTRGATKRLFSDNTNAESTATDSLTSFDTDGFSLGSSAGINESGQTYVAWCWKAKGGTTSSNTDGTITSTVQANTKAGFSIVKWTGTGAQGTIGHGLSAAPELIFSKKLDSANNWTVYQKDLSLSHSTYPDWLYLNGNNPQQNSVSSANHPYYQAPSSTLIYQNTGTSELSNVNGAEYISYCFAEKAGYSKSGTYTGNGSAAGPIVTTGFEPAFIIIKRIDSADNWSITDNKRSTSNPRVNALFPNLAQAELTGGYSVSYLSNGFQIATAGAGVNANGGTFLYIAFASDPSTAPVLADSFNESTWLGNSGNQPITGYGFKPNFVWIKNRQQADQHMIFDTLRGAENYISSNLTSAEASSAVSLLSFDSDGFTLGGDGRTNTGTINYMGWAWKANSIPAINTDGTIQSIVSANANAGFSIIDWTAPSSGDYSVGHGLSSTPDLVIIKPTTNAVGWLVWQKNQTNLTRSYLRLNTSDAEATAGSQVWGTGMTSTTIGLNVNATSGGNVGMIAYCFHSVSGYSKIGIYTGNGSATGPAVTTGFQPDYLMIKRTDGTGYGWYIFDSVRSPSNPRTLFVAANAASAEGNIANSVDFNSTSFQLKNTDPAWNQSGGTYIYMAFKIN